MSNYWQKLKDLFDADDGSLPDVFIDELSGEQVCAIYSWIMSQATIYDAPTLWHALEGKEIPIRSVNSPAAAVVRGEIPQFRHGLTNFQVAGVELYGLTICVSSNQISFDYQMGDDWDAPQVTALLDLLTTIRRLAPDAQISHQFEGAGKNTPGFTETVQEYSQNS